MNRLVNGFAALARASKSENAAFGRPPDTTPGYGDLGFEMHGSSSRAFYGRTEVIAIRDSAGRISAEVVAPSPPATPRLIPGQRISAAHVAFLIAQLEGGAFLPDPSAHGADKIRVVVD